MSSEGRSLGRAVEGNKWNVTIRSQVQRFFNEKTIFTKLQFVFELSNGMKSNIKLL
jgi:hypothetical protein